MTARIATQLALVAALVLGAGAAAAQDHGAGDHPATAAPAGGDEHGAPPGSADAEGGARHGEPGEPEHHLQRINWAQFGGTVTDEHGQRHPAPVPFAASVINFALLLLILVLAVRRTINPALSDRRAAVESELNEAQRLRAAAEAVHREYSERLGKLDEEIASLRREFVTAGERERDRIVAEARDKAERMRKEGEFAIAQELKQLRADLVREAVEAAVESAEKAVRTATTSADQTRLADEYVASLEKTGSTGAAA
jgi:F-type H+-transporting ATPase subunit b